MAELQDTDKFLVNRSGNSYQLTTENLMAELLDDDLMLVNRAGVSYKATGLEIKESIDTGPTGSIEAPVVVLTPVNGAGTNAGQPYNPMSTAITAVGAGGDVVYETDTISNVSSFNYTNDITFEPGNYENTGSSKSNGFDGSLSTFVDCRRGTNADTTNIKFTPVTAITGVTKLRVYQQYADKYSLNGASQVTISSGNGWVTVHDGAAISLTSIAVLRTSGNIASDYGHQVAAYEINDSILINENVLTFPTDNNFDKFEVGDVLQNDWNQSQEWSALATTTNVSTNAGNSIQDLFSSNLAAGPRAASAGSDGIITFPSGTISGNVRVYTGTSQSPQNLQYKDGNTLLNIPPVNQDWLDLGNIDLTYLKFEWSNSGAILFVLGIELDGKQLVDPSVPNTTAVSITAINNSVPSITTDGGSWYGADGTGDAGDGRYTPSQEWSNSFTASAGSFFPGYLAPCAFNGDVGDGEGDYAQASNGNNPSILTFEPPGGIPYNSKVEIWSLNTANYASINDGTYTQINNQDWLTIATGSGTLNKVCIKRESTSGASLGAIRIDGKILVNSSIPGGPGSTDISKTVTSQATLTFTDDTELANMVGPLTQVDENGDVKTPVTSTIASVAGVTWSDAVTFLGTEEAPASLAFDGDLTTSVNSSGSATTQGQQFTIWAGYTNALLEIYSSGNSAASLDIEVNGSNVVTDSSNTLQWLNAGNVSTGDVITVKRDYNGDHGSGFYAVRLDGVVLIDSTLLTFNSPNPDLQYFQPGDQVGTSSGFAPVAYQGNGSSQSIDCGFSTDLVWIKCRNEVVSHALMDTVRGPRLSLSSDTTGAEVSGENVTAFNSDGFTLSYDSSVNEAGKSYIAWCWDAGDTTVTNNDGTIESQVRSNGNFSVVKFTGAAGALVGHGLSKPPSLIITKSYSSSSLGWPVYMETLGKDQYLILNSPNASATSANVWGTSSPTDTVFGVDTNADSGNNSGDMIAYCWAETEGVSSFGEYSSNGSTPGPVIDCGFEPAFVMIKQSNSINSWVIYDNARNTANPRNTQLQANSADQEYTNNTYSINFTSTGFEIIGTDQTINGGYSAAVGNPNYIYAAFSGFNPIEVVDVDVAANTMTVDGNGYEVGDTVTGPPLIASANDVEYLDGNTLGVNGVSGSWREGLIAKGAEITATAPSPESIQYTSANGDPLTTAFTGTDATLTTRTWTWQVSNAVTGPWSDFATRVDAPGQDGAVPLADRPTLEENKFYQVKVRYDSSNAEFVESTFNTFKTGDN